PGAVAADPQPSGGIARDRIHVVVDAWKRVDARRRIAGGLEPPEIGHGALPAPTHACDPPGVARPQAVIGAHRQARDVAGRTAARIGMPVLFEASVHAPAITGRDAVHGRMPMLGANPDRSAIR